VKVVLLFFRNVQCILYMGERCSLLCTDWCAMRVLNAYLRNGGIGTSGGTVIRFLADNLVFKIFVNFRVLLGEDILEMYVVNLLVLGYP
jgi:hypothetical protein